GVVQIAVGAALICTGFGATVGMGLVTEGAADLFTAYRAYSTRQFSWSDYGKQKAVSLVISAVSMGFSSIKDAAKGAQTVVTGAGQELLEQAGTKLITSGKSAGTTLIQTGKNLKSLAVKFTGVTIGEAALREVIDDFNEIMKLVSDTITEQVFRITQSQLISPWSTYGMGELTKAISERVQHHFIVDTNQNSDSQNRENQQLEAEKGGSKYNTIAKQIRYNAKDYTIAYSQCDIIYQSQHPQQRDVHNTGTVDKNTKEYIEEVRSDKPANLSDMMALAAENNLDIKIVDDENYQPTEEDKAHGTNIIVYTQGTADANGNVGIGHFQLMSGDGTLIDIPSEKNN
ncbi:unnamed protein product, partial [Rotaria sp. Silwood1]